MRSSQDAVRPSKQPHAGLATAQVRAGEGQAEAAGTVLTNPVWKQSTYASLSTRGRAQARAPDQAPPLRTRLIRLPTNPVRKQSTRA